MEDSTSLIHKGLQTLSISSNPLTRVDTPSLAADSIASFMKLFMDPSSSCAEKMDYLLWAKKDPRDLLNSLETNFVRQSLYASRKGIRLCVFDETNVHQGSLYTHAEYQITKVEPSHSGVYRVAALQGTLPVHLYYKSSIQEVLDWAQAHDLDFHMRLFAQKSMETMKSTESPTETFASCLLYQLLQQGTEFSGMFRF
jgi:hypothetical protein